MKTRSQLQFIFNITISMLLVSSSSCKQEKKTQTIEEQEHQLALDNDIKSIKEYQSVFLGDAPQKELCSHETFFNEDGNKTKEMNYSTEDDKGTVITYDYDKHGHKVSSKAIYPDGSILFTTTLNYYEDGNRKELYFYLPDGTYKYRNTATYDNKGDLINLKWYWPTGFKAENKYVYIDRKMTENSEYNSEGKFLYRWIYNYDKRDNLIEAIQYYPNNQINSKIIYVYNNKNLLIKQDNLVGESIQNTVLFEYNNKNLLSKKEDYTASGKISTTSRYEYEYY